MITILIFSACISLAYIILIRRFITGWNLLPENHDDSAGSIILVSVIVAFRNEENTLPGLIKALKKQSYPDSFFEIIFVDDNSDDRSVVIVNEYIQSGGNARLLKLGTSDYGKKKALAIAAAEAKGELLLFTDADCKPTVNWIRCIASFYEKEKPVLIAAPVVMQSFPDFFSRFQSLEFYSLIGSTAGAFGTGDPFILNGANMAVQKNIYRESINFLQNQTLSGDDVFLLLHLKKNFPGRLFFLKSRNAQVIINPEPGIFAFLKQRLRWTSKSKFYRDKTIIITAVIVLLINLWLLNCFIMSFFSFTYLITGSMVFLIKTSIDFVFLRKVLRFFKEDSLLRIFVLSQFLYFLYISFTGITGNFIPSKWKGRTTK